MIIAVLFALGILYFLTLFTLNRIHKRHMEVMRIRYKRQIDSLNKTINFLEHQLGFQKDCENFLKGNK